MEITAADMARLVGIDPKRFRAALRKAALGWHGHNDAWTVEVGSDRHRQLQAVLAALREGRSASRSQVVNAARQSTSDEVYILDTCDNILGVRAVRQHRFDFLRGDRGGNGVGRCLPVDAWYPSLNMVVEFREWQHAEPAAFFDRRQTVSGVGRGEQRALYDQRRRDTFAARGIRLVELNVGDFEHDRRKRLARTVNDREVVRRALANPPPPSAPLPAQPRSP